VTYIYFSGSVIMPVCLQPLVSVNIPTRNAEKTLAECIKAIHDQSYKNVEVIVVDSSSADRTLEIALDAQAKIIQSKYKLLGARYEGVRECKGEYVLLLDADQIIYPDTIQRLVDSAKIYDMICLEETSYNPETLLEKLFVADRALINSQAYLDPVRGAMSPRFYKRSLLDQVFSTMPMDRMGNIVAHEDAIIFYESHQLSKNVGVLKKAVMHKEPSTFMELWRKNYRYGMTTQLMVKSHLYPELLHQKRRFRKGMSLSMESLKSSVLLMLKGIPFMLGVARAKIAVTP
jgi:glycosyltransferase involved in cell wall biosynthesis